ncbi:MAG TPA: hypothetical protein VFK05_05880 [Polyangiaceae bacterium]|nr:hypothetical protein [Polyangiaceae bacterium]
MVEVRLSRLCAALALVWVCASFLLASCATPEFKFVDSNRPPHCQNQQRDEGESDVDCGGMCAPCALTLRCNSATDCREGDCIDGVCQAATCNNGTQDGSETDTDCGGGACKGCPVGGACNDGLDCQSGVCGEAGCAEPTCGDRVTNGNESDIDCGGLDCPSCVAGQKCLVPSDCVGNDCSNGKCALSCGAGTGNCDTDPTDCETNLRTDAEHCGECAIACSLPHSSPSCVGGMCSADHCIAPFADCNSKAEDGCEVDTSTDVEHCGGCNAKPCPALNAEAYCEGGKCGFNCADNFEDCDGKPGNGCERDVSRDINNCGGCGKVCSASAGKTAWCRNGQCGETTCAAGRGDCNGNPDDDPDHGGCETDLLTDVTSCNACGSVCGVSGGEPQCSAGVCSIKSCSSGMDDCNGKYEDGCETRTDTDLTNCGACGKKCTVTNGTAVCVDGTCQAQTCTAPYADCNNNGSDGCETNTTTSQTHCGACTGNAVNCDTAFPHAVGKCENSVCTKKACATGYDDCDSVESNGCESNLNTDANNCGTCKKACSGAGAAGPNCFGGVCSPMCTGGMLVCSGNPDNGCLINSATDENNCGGCGPNAQYVCDNSANAHLGAQGNQCQSGKCKPQCDTTNFYADCDSNPNNGCEKSVATDVNNCGGCGANYTCANINVNSAPTCASGKCKFDCKAGLGACGAPSEGCATPLGTVNDCKACGDACMGATPFCTAGGCSGHLDIGVVGTPVSATASFQSGGIPKLSAAHTLTNSKAAGRYRILLVAVTATEAYFTTTKTVLYGPSANPNIVMHRAVESKAGGSPGSYAAIYYLLDDELPINAGAYAVSVQFSAGTQTGAGSFAVSEFQNVQQTPSPFVATPSNTDTSGCGNPSIRSVPLNFSQAGSFGYVALSARQGSNASVVAGTVTETMYKQQPEPGPMSALAGYVGPINGNATPSWNISTCTNSAGAGVVLKRVGD